MLDAITELFLNSKLDAEGFNSVLVGALVMHYVVHDDEQRGTVESICEFYGDEIASVYRATTVIDAAGLN